MDRKPEHLAADPNLRAEFIAQMSLDEYLAIHAPFFLHPNARQLVEEGMKRQGMNATYEAAFDVAKENWIKTLDPQTNGAELFYLSGLVTPTQRQQVLDQVNGAIRADNRRASAFGLIEEYPEDKEFKEKFGE